MLDIHRAKAILDSPEHIEVKLDNESIWIDSVNMNDRTVTIHSENGPDKHHQTISVDRLQEI